MDNVTSNSDTAFVTIILGRMLEKIELKPIHSNSKKKRKLEPKRIKSKRYYLETLLLILTKMPYFMNSNEN